MECSYKRDTRFIKYVFLHMNTRKLFKLVEFMYKYKYSSLLNCYLVVTKKIQKKLKIYKYLEIG